MKTAKPAASFGRAAGKSRANSPGLPSLPAEVRRGERGYYAPLLEKTRRSAYFLEEPSTAKGYVSPANPA